MSSLKRTLENSPDLTVLSICQADVFFDYGGVTGVTRDSYDGGAGDFSERPQTRVYVVLAILRVLSLG